MAIQINDGFQNNSPKPNDTYYAKFSGGVTVPYASVTEANNIVTQAYRSIGKTLLVYKSGVPVEYWYRTGITDGNLIEKSIPPVTDYNSLTNIPDLTLYALKSTTINGFSLSTNITITKSDVGLSLVDNTTDVAKPVSSLQQVALNTKQDISQKNQANGYAGIQSNGIIPSYILPSYIDQIVEYATYSAFPSTGMAGTVYLDKSTGVQWRWSGTQYSSITSGAVQSVNGAQGNVVISFQSPITLTTTGSSGVATFQNNVLNIPSYTGGSGGSAVVVQNFTPTLTFDNAGGKLYNPYAQTGTITLSLGTGNQLGTFIYAKIITTTDPIVIPDNWVVISPITPGVANYITFEYREAGIVYVRATIADDGSNLISLPLGTTSVILPASTLLQELVIGTPSSFSFSVGSILGDDDIYSTELLPSGNSVLLINKYIAMASTVYFNNVSGSMSIKIKI